MDTENKEIGINKSNFLVPALALALIVSLTGCNSADVRELQNIPGVGIHTFNLIRFYLETGFLGHAALGGTIGLIVKMVESFAAHGLAGINHILEEDTLEKIATGAILAGVVDNMTPVSDFFSKNLQQPTLLNYARIGGALGIALGAIPNLIHKHKIPLEKKTLVTMASAVVDGTAVGIVAGAATHASNSTETLLYALPIIKIGWPQLQRLRQEPK